MRGAAAFLAALATLIGAPTTVAGAGPDGPYPRVVDLRVTGGNGWRAENRFPLTWSFEMPPGAPPVVAVHYRLLDKNGAPIDGAHRIPPLERLESVSVPTSGAFLIDIRAEGAGGQLGQAARTNLLLDQTRPGPTQPVLPGGWIGSTATHLRLARPQGPEPPSGLGGYAVSVDADPAGSPCASAERCREDELDVRGGDSLVLSDLPEGRVHIHAVAVSGAGMRSEQVGTTTAWVDATPPRVALQGVPSGWANGAVRVAAAAADALSGVEAAGTAGPFTAIAVDGGRAVVEPGGAAAALVSGDGVHRVEAYARDAAGNVDPIRGASAATVRIDGTPPRVAFANRREPAPERLEATVGDSLSGPSAGRGTIAFRPARSRQPFVALPTAVSAGRLLARWDGDAHPPGTYEFQATGYDAAGNVAKTVARADGTAMLVVNPQKARTSLRAGFGRDRARAQAAAYGRPDPIAGRLTTSNGSPLGGEEIAVTEEFDAGAAQPRRTSAVRTAADGTFELRLGAGPNRRVTLSFEGGRALAPSAATPLRVEVRSGVTMRASSTRARVGGKPVAFRGRVRAAGAPIPADGIPVELQFRLPGLPWSEFRTVTTDRQGRFEYRYAFADDDSRGVRFRFRAVVAARQGWPYATGASRPIAVTGS